MKKIITICIMTTLLQSAIGSTAIVEINSGRNNNLANKVVPLMKSVTVSGNINIEYAETGDANGAPVIFLHGYSDSWKSYQPILPYLPASIHSYYLSQRGHGNSSKPVSGYHPKDFAQDVADFMKLLNIPSAIIVGHSMGGTVAQRFVLDFPDKAKALVLIGSFPSFRNNNSVKELRAYINNLSAPVDTAFISDFQKSSIFKPVPPDYFNTVVSESLKLPAHVWKGVSSDLLSSDLTPELPAIKCPTLIVWGNKDSFCLLQDKNTLLQAIPGSVVKEYDGVGHAVHWEDPKRVADDLTSFIREVK